jgi:hypothetical protein
MGLLPENSLGGKMLKTVTDLFPSGDEEAAAPAPEGDTPKGSRLLPKKNTALEDAVSDIDSRASQGDITFRDFLTMSKTISGMGEDMSALPPGLSAKQILELREKISRHEKIVEARHARSPEPWAHAHARTHARRRTHTHRRTHTRTHAQTRYRTHQVMMEDEKDDPELLLEDLKAGGSTPGPRMQRLATASGESEQEVGLFLMQFEVRLPSPRPFP